MQVIQKILSLFFIYSFLGWILEVIYVSIYNRRFSNRGFLIGPICPIYGCACAVMTLVLGSYSERYLFVLVASFFLCTILEYLTSYVMEKMFKTRWWDYSKRKFNINGRVCLRNSLLFGVLGMIVVTTISPYLLSILKEIPNYAINIILIVLVLFLLVDISISYTVMHKIKVAADDIKKDNTDEINKKIREYLIKQSFLYQRVVIAFPNFRLIERLRKK